MDFQEEPGRIFAMQDGTLIAEITFPEQDGVAVFDHTFVDGSLRGRGVPGRGPSGPGPGRKSAPGLLLCPKLVCKPPGGGRPAGALNESAFAAFRT